jgi:hypothetical protein
MSIFSTEGAGRNNCQPVQCIQTGEFFESQKAAAEWVGVSGYYMSKSIDEGIKINGLSFRRVKV